MSLTIFLPIKEQSERVPDKNFRNINGLPLWKHCIEKLQKYNVYIDTDSDEIFEESKSYNYVTCYKRDNNLIGHNISVVDIIKNFISKFNIKTPICQIHVTSPFLDTKHIDQSFDILLHTDYNSVFSVTKTQKRFWSKDIKPLNHNPKILLPTQQLEPWFEENSYLYTFWPDVIKDYNNRICNEPYMIEIEYPNNLDIDTEDDWKLIKNIV
tara:strand:+ start:564 stop:1196 length:633 start_codon:yes stop_codon:yes gene_type:complete